MTALRSVDKPGTYRGKPLDSPNVADFHQAINLLRWDTCQRGTCSESGLCGYHRQQDTRRAHREAAAS